MTKVRVNYKPIRGLNGFNMYSWCKQFSVRLHATVLFIHRPPAPSCSFVGPFSSSVLSFSSFGASSLLLAPLSLSSSSAWSLLAFTFSSRSWDPIQSLLNVMKFLTKTIPKVSSLKRRYRINFWYLFAIAYNDIMATFSMGISFFSVMNCAPAPPSPPAPDPSSPSPSPPAPGTQFKHFQMSWNLSQKPFWKSAAWNGDIK